MRAAFVVQNDDGSTLVYELIPPIQYNEDYEYPLGFSGIRHITEPTIHVTIEAIRGEGRLFTPGDQVFTETRPIESGNQSITS